MNGSEHDALCRRFRNRTFGYGSRLRALLSVGGALARGAEAPEAQRTAHQRAMTTQIGDFEVSIA